MVESPTYFHSLSPILRSLKEFDVEDFALQPEIIYARHSREMPSYLKGATCRTSIVCSTKTTANTIGEEQKDEPEEQVLTDSSETESVEGEDLDALSDHSSDDKMRPSEDKRVGLFKLLSEWLSENSSRRISEADQSSAETSNEDTGSHKKLGKRMEVERFVEFFNSSSESSLEASQCEALTHALKNKLAIIQGQYSMKFNI